VAVVAVSAVVVGAGCGSSGDDGERTAPAELVDSGSWYVRERWPHDGKPVESETFVVYSDAASVEARREVTAVAEDVWAELLDEASIDPATLHNPEGQDKLHIYAYRGYDPRDWDARAYYGGVIMWSPDHEHRSAAVRFAPVLRHELVHALQWLIAGPDPNPVDTWFLEGLPEAVTGGTSGGAIRGRDQLDDLTTEYGTVNPISVKTYDQITSPESGERFSYPMFQLAVEYLMDDDGYGRSPEDAWGLLVDVAEGATFDAAFEDRMGTSLDEYERDFFGLMDDYLPPYRNPVFSPAGFAVVSAVVVAFVIGAPTIGYRRWRRATPTGQADDPGPGRTARIGFYGEMTLAGAIVIAFFLGVLFVAGTTPELNNTLYATARTRIYWFLVVYLLASVGLVLWAVNRWVHRARSALLVAPLVIAATGATMLIIIAASGIS